VLHGLSSACLAVNPPTNERAPAQSDSRRWRIAQPRAESRELREAAIGCQGIQPLKTSQEWCAQSHKHRYRASLLVRSGSGILVWGDFTKTSERLLASSFELRALSLELRASGFQQAVLRASAANRGHPLFREDWDIPRREFTEKEVMGNEERWIRC
jgi:hypothetical protein